MTKLLWYPFSDFDLLQVLALHSSLSVIQLPLTAFGTCKKTLDIKEKFLDSYREGRLKRVYFVCGLL